jgi:hypothetical protein
MHCQWLWQAAHCVLARRRFEIGHVDSKVNDQFLQWLGMTYASDDIGHVKAIRGNHHDYLAMILDFSIPGVLQVDMTPYVESMIEEFPDKLSGKTKMPWNENLFKVDPTSKHLETEQVKVLHTFVMKGMFLCKRGCQDIQPAVTFMVTRVTEPNEGDWKKLVKMMNYLKATKDDIPSMSANDTSTMPPLPSTRT